jgi:hypothetical protein
MHAAATPGPLPTSARLAAQAEKEDPTPPFQGTNFHFYFFFSKKS